MRVPDSLMALPLALAACSDADKNDTSWAIDTATEPAANMRLYELEGSESATANAEGQSMGCIGLETDDTNAQLTLVLAQLAESPAEYLFDRTAVLKADGEPIATADASLEGDLLFNNLAEGVSLASNSNYQLCLEGNPGSLTGTFQYEVKTPSSFTLAEDNRLGSAQTYPVKFTPFTVE